MMTMGLDLSACVDSIVDRSVVAGYGTVGLAVRRHLPGWPQDPPAMDGKVVVVTGAASGIGLGAARGFAELGATVHVVARTVERADEAARLTARGLDATGRIEPGVCDVSDLSSVHAFADRFVRRDHGLDVLVNNAGVMPPTRQFTADGIELTFATHVLGPFVLTERLAPLLAAATPGRVVNVTSGGQYSARLTPSDPQSLSCRYRPATAYARTKRQQVMLTRQWAKRYPPSEMVVHAMHPGWADTQGVQDALPAFRVLSRPILRTPEQGADTIVWLGAAPEPARSSGLLWHDRRPRPYSHALGPRTETDRECEDLWNYTAALAERSAPTSKD